MSRKYYPLLESINILQEFDANFGMNELSIYAQEKLIRPLVYIDSLPAHACEGEGADGLYTMFASGHCYLTAYFDVGDEIIVFLNILKRGNEIEIVSPIFINQLVGEPLISSWQINDNFFKNVPLSRHRLKKSKEESEILAFLPLEKLKAANVVLTNDDLEKLKKILIERQCTFFEPEKNMDDLKKFTKKPSNQESTSDGDNKKVPNELHKVIIRAYKALHNELNRNPKADEVWGVIFNLKYDSEELIQTKDENKITWLNKESETKTMSFDRFANFLSDYKKGKYFDS